MMPFRKLNPRSRRAIGYATLTYAGAVLLLLAFAGAAISATAPESSSATSSATSIAPPPVSGPAAFAGSVLEGGGLFPAIEDPARLLAGTLALLLALAMLVYTRRAVMRLL